MFVVAEAAGTFHGLVGWTFVVEAVAGGWAFVTEVVSGGWAFVAEVVGGGWVACMLARVEALVTPLLGEGCRLSAKAL
jgi:hypothetical protein